MGQYRYQLIFREREGRTFVLPRAMVETLGYTQYEYTCRMISLEVHSSLAAVGEKRHSSDAKIKSSFWCFSLFLSKIKIVFL